MISVEPVVVVVVVVAEAVAAAAELPVGAVVASVSTPELPRPDCSHASAGRSPRIPDEIVRIPSTRRYSVPFERSAAVVPAVAAARVVAFAAGKRVVVVSAAWFVIAESVC